MLSLAALCCDTDGRNPTENAIISAAKEAGISQKKLLEDYPVIKTLPFDSERKLMTTLHRLKGGRVRIVCKGAPEAVISRCSHVLLKTAPQEMTEIIRREASAKAEAMAANGLRVLAVACRECPSSEAGSPESSLTLAGFIGLADPPRPEVKEAVRKCRRAGIRPVMITGDHLSTARSIARSLGIMTARDGSLTGAQIDAMSPNELKEACRKTAVFARVTPEHKVKIVKAFKALGETVAMTGDGVNDAPALKEADIGCAMGIAGTDVARSAADMVLTDDNFATIVSAAEQGRGIFKNIRRAARFLLSSNIGEVTAVFASYLFRFTSPLSAIQLLWVNLLTDSLPAIALGSEKVPASVMDDRPEKRGGGLFTGAQWWEIVSEGLMVGALAVLGYTIGRVNYDLPGTAEVGRTMAFSVLGLCQLFHAYNARSEGSVFSVGFFSNMKLNLSALLGIALQAAVVMLPSLNKIFDTVALNSEQWLITAALSAAPVAVVELHKALSRKSGRQNPRL